MVPVLPLQPKHQFLLEEAAVLEQVSGIVFASAFLGLITLAFLWVYKRFPGQVGRLRHQLQHLLFPGSQRIEARLERVVCYNCNRGTGLYDPVYLSYHGESYIEGICSCCGGFVRARLR